MALPLKLSQCARFNCLQKKFPVTLGKTNNINVSIKKKWFVTIAVSDFSYCLASLLFYFFLFHGGVMKRVKFLQHFLNHPCHTKTNNKTLPLFLFSYFYGMIFTWHMRAAEYDVSKALDVLVTQVTESEVQIKYMYWNSKQIAQELEKWMHWKHWGGKVAPMTSFCGSSKYTG